MATVPRLRPHPLLGELFASLQRRGVLWSLLRVPADLSAPTGDVDILVAPGDGAALTQAAEEVGFVALPGWDAPPNLLLVTYAAGSDTWLILDVLTTVSFRALPFWELPEVARGVLARRRIEDSVARPDDGDAFWLLLWHCLLDKRTIAPRHRRDLQALAAAGESSPVGRAVLSAAAGDWSPGALIEAARGGRWEHLEGVGRQLAPALERARPSSERLGWRLRRLVASARRPLLLRRRRGVSVALLGPNGVGKSTAAAGLRERFPFDSRLIYMGLWKARPRGRGPAAVDPLLRPLRIWTRYLRARYHQLTGRLVIFDRYVAEAKLPAAPPLVALKKPYFWFLSHCVPSPDATVVLDVPGAVAYGRKQENPPEELESERRLYARLATSHPSVALVDASREAAAVRGDITAIVWRLLARRWQPRQPPAAVRRRAVPDIARLRRALDAGRLAGACALIPRVLETERDRLPASVHGALITGAQRTSTGMAVVELSRTPQAPC